MKNVVRKLKDYKLLPFIVPSLGLTIEQITAQAFVFFIAGYTTDTSVLSFCLFELSQNKEIQEKLCREVETSVTKHQGQITYQALQEMTYMDQVVNGMCFVNCQYLPKVFLIINTFIISIGYSN